MKNVENPSGSIAERNQKRKKQINMWYIVIAVVVLIGAVAVTAAIISNRNKKDDTVIPEESIGESEEKSENITPVSAADDVDFTFENVSRDFLEELEFHQETTSFAVAEKTEVFPLTTDHTTETVTQVSVTEFPETTTKTQETTEKNDGELAQIQAFFECSFYMDGMMESGGSKTPLELAVNGNDIHVFSEMDGMDIAIMKLDGKLYLMNPDKKKYIIIDSAIKKMMGLDDEMLSFDFMKIKFDSENPVSVTKAQFNGSDAVCYEYKSTESGIDFIAADGEIKQIIQYQENGTVSSVITLDEFSAEIPAEMLSFKGYSKTNMISFLSEMMQGDR